MKRLCLVASYSFPAMLAIAIWVPILRAYYVPNVKVSEAALQQARYVPSDSVLNQVKNFRLLGAQIKNSNELLDTASMLLKGKLKIQDCDTSIQLPFSPNDLDRLPGDCALFFAGFYVP